MLNKKLLKEGLTFDDILLVPAKSNVLPKQVNITTYLTTDIKLNIPIVSAAMDTVTESAMAIAIAREGGIGIIHKNMPIDIQCQEVDIVKRSESGMIVNPITLTPDKPLYQALELMKKFNISGIPIVNYNNELVGILTNRDLRFQPNPKIPVSELMTKENLITAPIGTTLEKAEKILQKYKIEKLPVVDKNNKLAGLITFKDIMKKKKHPSACKDHLGRLRVGAAIGVSSDSIEHFELLTKAGADVIVIDTAHGHSEKVLKLIKNIRKKFKYEQIIAGNVATTEAAKDLINCKVNAIKVGIGPGSICTTRVIAGVGIPQITAIANAYYASSKAGIPIIADGGIRFSGDIPKAIAAGADSVMIGSLFAGTDESPGEKILYEGRSYKIYRGMGSIAAMKQGSKDRYFQDAEDEISKLVPEGVEGRVPYKGPLSDTIYQIIGGLKAAMGYCGTKNLQDLKKKSKFIKVTFAGLKENHPHDITITQEAPNYSLIK